MSAVTITSEQNNEQRRLKLCSTKTASKSTQEKKNLESQNDQIMFSYSESISEFRLTSTVFCC